MIAIVNCHGDWIHTQKKGVNGAFLVLAVLQKENLPEATESSITCSICPSSTFPSSSNSLSATFPLVRFPNPLAFGSGLGERTLKKAIFQLRRPVVWKIYIVGPKLGTYLESAVYEISKNHPEN